MIDEKFRNYFSSESAGSSIPDRHFSPTWLIPMLTVADGAMVIEPNRYPELREVCGRHTMAVVALEVVSRY